MEYRKETWSKMPRKTSYCKTLIAMLEIEKELLRVHIRINDYHAETYSELYQTSKVELLAKIINRISLLTIFVKSSNLDVWLGSESASYHIHPTDDNQTAESQSASRRIDVLIRRFVLSSIYLSRPKSILSLT